MRMRALRREHVGIIVFTGIIGLGLAGVSVVWPPAFGIVVAIGGSVGALMVLYEVRMTKRIAQGEFIRDLQSGFVSDPNIVALWEKLLTGQEITEKDRPLVSSYLTFFETLHLLLSRGALELDLTDDLFRNRFFTAVGNRGIQDTALIAQAGAFANIHALIAIWHDHMTSTGVPIHPGYYSYVERLVEVKGFRVRTLGESDLPDVLALQDRVLADLADDSWLRRNEPEMLRECLTTQQTLGAFCGDDLASLAVLYDAGDSPENLAHHLKAADLDAANAINLKVVLTDPTHRRNGLSRALIELLEQQASLDSKQTILCTIHAKNIASQRLFERLGYVREGKTRTSYGVRHLYRRELPSLNRIWPR